MMGKVLVAIIGASSGLVVATGLLSFIISLGLISKLAYRTHTAHAIPVYKVMVELGGIIGNAIYIFEIKVAVPYLLLPILGLCIGAFVGCWALSIAEVINIIPLFVRRFQVAKYLKYIIFVLAIGKVVGAVFLFITA